MAKLDGKQYADFWRNVHKDTNDDLAAVCFPDKPRYFNSFFNRIQIYILMKYFRKANLDLTGKDILDIGCGRGRWLSFYSAIFNSRVKGIDLSADAVQICKNKGFDVIEGSITDMPFEDNSFDVVNSITVLLHLPYEIKKEAVTEIARVLKAGGKAILIESTWQDTSPHVYGLSVQSWCEIFNSCNMSLVHASGHYFNIFRRKLPLGLPRRDLLSIYLDYPLEYALMNYFYGKQSDLGLQHLMVFEKRK